MGRKITDCNGYDCDECDVCNYLGFLEHVKISGASGIDGVSISRDKEIEEHLDKTSPDWR